MAEQERIGVSAAERDVRLRVEKYKDEPDIRVLPIYLGVLRAILRDLDMWREMASNLEPRPVKRFVPGDE